MSGERDDTGVMTRVREHDWAIGIGAGLIASAALVGGSEFGRFHSSNLHPKLVAWISAAILLVFGVIAVRRIAAGLGNLVTQRSVPAAGAAARLLATGAGYVMLLFAEFALLGVSIEHLLIGAGLAGVVLGIAAQQSLGNIFAALVLLLARPFKVGDYIRIRSGPLGGIFEARVLAGGGPAPLPASSRRDRLHFEVVGPAKPSLMRYHDAHDKHGEHQ